jgi:hypothetical protein
MTNAGWHPDPLGRHQLRYFDGEQWTPHVVDGSDVSFDPLAPSTPEVTPDEATSDSRSRTRARTRTRRVQWLVLAGIILLVGAATLGTLAFAGSSGTQTATVRGSFSIRNGADGSPSFIRGRGGRCSGGPRLSDVDARTSVLVDGDHGNRIARTTLGTGHVAGDACVFRFAFNVEKGERYYVVSVGNRSSAAYSFTQLEQPDAVALVIAAR